MPYEPRAWTPTRVITRATAQKGERIERRRYDRVKMELPARYLTPEGEEFECVTVDFSPAGVRFRSEQAPAIGAEVIAYVRDLGRLQGNVVRRPSDGFVLAVNGTALKTERLLSKIAWLKPEGVKDRRLFPRVVIEGAMIQVRCEDGRNEIVPIIDVSAGGIAFQTKLALKIGDKLQIGEQSGIVARVFDDGAAARFT